MVSPQTDVAPTAPPTRADEDEVTLREDLVQSPHGTAHVVELAEILHASPIIRNDNCQDFC